MTKTMTDEGRDARVCETEGCREPLAGPCARYCERCGKTRRCKPRKYPWGPAEDGVLRAAYEAHRSRKALRVAMLRTGYPKHAVSRRAAEIGLRQPSRKEPPWSVAEQEILERNSWRGARRLVGILAAAGFWRTETAVVVRRKRSQVSSDGYTLSGLAALLGVDPKTTSEWARRGWLRSRACGTRRTALQGGDQQHVTQEAARQFVLEHPHRVDLRKVSDPLWFIDLVSGGRAGLSVDEAKREDGVEGHGTLSGYDLPG